MIKEEIQCSSKILSHKSRKSRIPVILESKFGDDPLTDNCSILAATTLEKQVTIVITVNLNTYLSSDSVQYINIQYFIQRIVILSGFLDAN